MNEEIKDQIKQIRKAILKRKYIDFTTEYFSEELLEALFEKGAFKPSEFNENDPWKDFAFLTEMLGKEERTEKQEKKIRALVFKVLLPFICSNQVE